MTDGHAYLGEHAFKHVTATAFTITDRLDESYITTASLRRSGCHPQPGELGDSPDQPTPLWEHSKGPHMEKLRKWIKGNAQPHSAIAANKLINMDKVRILHKYKPTVTLSDCPMIAIPSNNVRAIIGTRMTSRINNALENDESP